MNTFVEGTIIQPDEVNDNFTEVKVDTSSQTGIANGGTITLGSSQHQHIRVGGSGAISLASAPFASTPTIPMRVTLIGTSDTNTVTISYANSAGGFVGNGNCTLGLHQTITVFYNPTDARWFEECRSHL